MPGNETACRWGHNGTTPLDRESGHLTLTRQASQGATSVTTRVPPLKATLVPGRIPLTSSRPSNPGVTAISQRLPIIHSRDPPHALPFSPTQSLPNPTACQSSNSQGQNQHQWRLMNRSLDLRIQEHFVSLLTRVYGRLHARRTGTSAGLKPGQAARQGTPSTKTKSQAPVHRPTSLVSSSPRVGSVCLSMSATLKTRVLHVLA